MCNSDGNIPPVISCLDLADVTGFADIMGITFENGSDFYTEAALNHSFNDSKESQSSLSCGAIYE